MAKERKATGRTTAGATRSPATATVAVPDLLALQQQAGNAAVAKLVVQVATDPEQAGKRGRAVAARVKAAKRTGAAAARR